MKRNNQIRIEENFNNNWLWFPCNMVNGMEPNLNEYSAKKVDVPHSNHMLELFDIKPSNWQFISWYRKHFFLNNEFAEKKVFIQFEGAGQLNKVYVNGSFAGESQGHFTQFRFDITEFLNFGDKENIIAIQVDNTEHQELPPTKKDFYYFGGIHRNVKLIITDPIYIEDVFYWTEKTENSIELKTTVKLVNSFAEKQNASIKLTLNNHLHETIAFESREIFLEGKSDVKLSISTVLDNPRLWTLDDPYLHKLTISVCSEQATEDCYSLNAGLRWVHFDPAGTENARFYLNDQAIRLWGMNRHEQFPYIGNAAPDSFHQRDARVLKSMGSNVVRTAHYPHSPAFLDECDRIGLLVEGENLGWQSIGDDGWKAAYEKQLETMIIRDRNHPSIFAWGVCVNEALEDLEWNRKLNAMSKKLDPTRATVNETCYRQEHVTDVYSLHDYLGDDKFKHGGDGMVPPYYQPWIVGEVNNVLGANFIIPNDNESRKLKMLEKDCLKLDILWGNPKVAGIYRWDAFGFLTPNGHHKWLAYMYQACGGIKQVGNVIHILNEWKSDSPSIVYVASNCDEVELFIDSDSLEKIKPNAFIKLEQGLFKWTDVTFIPGSKLIAKGYRNGTVVCETKRYAAAYDNSERLLLESQTGPTIKTRSDMAWVQITALDKNSQHSPYEDGNVLVELNGHGELVCKHNPMPLYDGQNAFYIKSDQVGKVNLTAKLDTGLSVNNNCTGSGINEFEYCPAGHWTYEKLHESYMGDVTVLNELRSAGDYVLFRFIGVQVLLYGSKRSNFGISAVSIDEGSEVDVNCYTTEEKERHNMMVYRSPMLKYGYHTLKIRVKMEKAPESKGYVFNVDRVKVLSGNYDCLSNELEIKVEEQPETLINTDYRRKMNSEKLAAPYVWNRVDIENQLISFYGKWKKESTTESFANLWAVAMNEPTVYTSEKEAYLQFNFTGTALKIFGQRSPVGGLAELIIDDNCIDVINFYNKIEQKRVEVYSIDGLKNEEHSLRIVVKGVKTGISSGCVVNLDSIVYH